MEIIKSRSNKYLYAVVIRSVLVFLMIKNLLGGLTTWDFNSVGSVEH